VGGGGLVDGEGLDGRSGSQCEKLVFAAVRERWECLIGGRRALYKMK
jgi:hypothetical protein